MNNKNENIKNINYNYPLTKIILPPHLKIANEKKKKGFIQNKKHFVDKNEEKKRMNNFLDLNNISDK